MGGFRRDVSQLPVGTFVVMMLPVVLVNCVLQLEINNFQIQVTDFQI